MNVIKMKRGLKKLWKKFLQFLTLLTDLHELENELKTGDNQLLFLLDDQIQKSIET